MKLSEADRDREYWDVSITEVIRERDGFEIVVQYYKCKGLRFFIPDERNKLSITPHVAEHCRFFGEGWGRPVRGVALNGQVVYWQSDADYRKKFL